MTDLSLLTREERGQKIVEVARSMREGYTNGLTQFSTDLDRATANACAMAASNTGFFILKALGYSGDEIKTVLKFAENSTQPPNPPERETS